MLIIGFSTGALAFDDFERALALLSPTKATAVELSALRYKELPKLLHALPSLWSELNSRYRYISFHAPTNFEDELGLVQQLAVVADMGLNIVVHPDTMKELTSWRALGDHLCIENMDSRKPVGRTAEELAVFFETLPKAKLCFDIAHARQVDATMTEANRILSVFGDRLAQTHFSELNSQGKHFPMSLIAKQTYELFAPVLSRVPLILESVVREDEISTELAQAESVLEQRVRLPT
jgi:hypothetical protein